MIIALTNEAKDREIPHRFYSLYESKEHAISDLKGRGFTIVPDLLDLYLFNLDENTAIIIDGEIITEGVKRGLEDDAK